MLVSAVPGDIDDIDVLLGISHDWVGDLTVSLSDGSSEVRLLDRPGLPGIDPQFGCSQPNIDALFDDFGGGPAENACSPHLLPFPYWRYSWPG